MFGGFGDHLREQGGFGPGLRRAIENKFGDRKALKVFFRPVIVPRWQKTNRLIEAKWQSPGHSLPWLPCPLRCNSID